jgi:serine phosphatase RsbU (regulator of sigma subunit)
MFLKLFQTIEEHVMKGMHLGTFSEFPYTLLTSELHAGDTTLLMSDGFPELFNDKKEMYGYVRTIIEFESVAVKEPEEIIIYLKYSASDWTNGNDPDDDVTYVVIKDK